MEGRALFILLLTGIVTALPTDHSHPGEAENHIEDEYLEDALANWLDNFDTYTFMVKQDLDHTHHLNTEEAAEEEEEESGGPEEEEEEDSEVNRESWNAPIAVTLDEHGLLNPHVDYQVLVDSLVAEAGSIFLTLSKYDNKSLCGVGGLTKENHASSPEHSGHRLAIGEEHSDIIINFDLQNEVNTNHSEGRSEWAELSEEYWWASGHLVGGGVLSLSFTPPECGCLTLSTYYALPVANLTLVVGPQAYPSELQMLLCVDHLPPYENSAEYEEEDEGDYMDDEEVAEIQALVAREDGSEMNGSGEGSEEGPHIVNGRSTRLESRRERKEVKRLAKKKKRQQKRQNIRQAGRRQARKQARNSRRNNRRGNHRARNHERQSKKAWRKIQRQNRQRQRINRRNNLAGLDGETVSSSSNNTEGETVNSSNNIEGVAEEQEGNNITSHHQAEEKLINILLGEPTMRNFTEGESETEASEGEECTAGVCEAEASEGEGEARGGRAWRRKNRRQRKKLKRRERKKAGHSPGDKFCCKQGVKHKKYIITINTTIEDNPSTPSCNSTNDIVTTFANHQFDISQERCADTFHTCCHKFTLEIWNTTKERKEERKMKRKQSRKSRKQQRKLTRKQRKMNRKANRRQGRQRGREEVTVQE